MSTKAKFQELFKIEAEARAPVVRAMQLEHKLRCLGLAWRGDRVYGKAVVAGRSGKVCVLWG